MNCVSIHVLIRRRMLIFIHENIYRNSIRSTSLAPSKIIRVNQCYTIINHENSWCKLFFTPRF